MTLTLTFICGAVVGIALWHVGLRLMDEFQHYRRLQIAEADALRYPAGSAELEAQIARQRVNV